MVGGISLSHIQRHTVTVMAIRSLAISATSCLTRERRAECAGRSCLRVHPGALTMAAGRVTPADKGGCFFTVGVVKRHHAGDRDCEKIQTHVYIHGACESGVVVKQVINLLHRYFGYLPVCAPSELCRRAAVK